MHCKKHQLDTLNYQDDIESLLKKAEDQKFYIVDFNCTKLKHTKDLLEEFAIKMKFPDYFGNNFNALFDCLSDLDWLPNNGYLLVFENSDELLSYETEDVLDSFLDILKETVQIWENEVKEGQEWDRDAVPFKILFN